MSKICLFTLGCVKNDVDSDTSLALLQSQGHTVTKDPLKADVLVLNTCGFIKQAKEESIERILELAEVKKQTGASLAVFGCLVKRYHDELASEVKEVDLFIAATEGADVSQVLAEYLKNTQTGRANMRRPFAAAAGQDLARAHLPRGTNIRRRPTLKNYAYVKIADGCSARCSFCSIPIIKGPYKSRELADIEAEAVELASNGVKELILVAQDTAAYGRDLPAESTFPDLLERLARIEGVSWLRALYMKPESISDELLTKFSSIAALVPYFDIPVQHVSSRVVKSMNRALSKEKLVKMFSNLRSCHPDATLRTSIMVGYPGETDDEFDEVAEFLRLLRFDLVSFFPYSAEEGTMAAGLEGQVDEETLRERSDGLLYLQEQIASEKAEALTASGRKRKIIIDSRDRRTIQTNIARIAQDFPGAISNDVRAVVTGHLLERVPHTDGLAFLGMTSLEAAASMLNNGSADVKIKASLGYDLYCEES